MNKPFNNMPFYSWLWKHKWPVLIIEAISIAATLVFTSPYFISPEYESSAIVYPFNIKPYSTESETEQLMQFFSSIDIKTAIIKNFNLIKHYKIDTTNKYWYHALLTTYNENINISHTIYRAAKISVLDVNPDTACMLVNALIKELNKKILSTQRQKYAETAQVLKKELDIKKAKIDSLASVSKLLSVNYGLLDYANQTREVEKAYYQMLASNRGGKAMNEASAQIKNLEEQGEHLKEVNRHLDEEVTSYDEVLAKYQEQLSDANAQLTFTNIATAPYPSYYKTFPIVWLDVLIVALSMLVCSVMLIQITEKIKNHKTAA